MSTIAVGTVGAAPLGAAFVVAGAGLLAAAAAGVGVCIVAGRVGVAGAQFALACGKAATDVVQENAARRRAQFALLARGRMIQPPEMQQLVALRLPVERRHKWKALSGRHKPAALPQVELVETAPPQVADTKVVGAVERGILYQRLTDLAMSYDRALQAFEAGGAWEGLFITRPLRELLEEARTQILNDKLQEARGALREVRRDLAWLEAVAPDRWEVRRVAASRCVQAEELLEALLLGSEQSVELAPTWALSLALIRETCEAARIALDGCDFQAALARAETALRLAEDLNQATVEPYRAQLTAAWDALSAELDTYAQVPEVVPVRNLLGQAGTMLEASELEFAAEILNQAQDLTEGLVRLIEIKYGLCAGRDWLIIRSMGALQAMGYEVWEGDELALRVPEAAVFNGASLRPEQAGARQLVARNGEKSIVVKIAEDATLWVDATQGFQGQECRTEVDIFIERVAAVQTIWDKSLVLEEAVGELREQLLSEGKVLIEEPFEGGVVLTVLDGEPPIKAQVGWNGEIQINGEPQPIGNRSPINEAEKEKRRERRWTAMAPVAQIEPERLVIVRRP